MRDKGLRAVVVPSGNQREKAVSFQAWHLPGGIMHPAAIAVVACCLLIVPPAAAGEVATNTELVERSVERGLAYLARAQQKDGGYQGARTGVTATCALAFMAHGHLPGRGEYGQQVAHAVDYLLDHRTSEGAIYDGGEAPMYQHGLATLALAEAFGESQDERLRPAITAAVDLIVRVQNPQGGWRHYLTTTDGAELPGSVVQLMALRAAYGAGFSVPPETISQGTAYVRDCQNRRGDGGDGGFCYDRNGASNWPRTGSGVASLQMAGNYLGTEIREGLDFIMEFEPLGTKPVPERHWWHFGSYYVSLGLYLGQNRGEWEKQLWERYIGAMEKRILTEQRADGSWEGPHGAYCSAMYLMILSLRLGYLPVHQK